VGTFFRSLQAQRNAAKIFGGHIFRRCHFTRYGILRLPTLVINLYGSFNHTHMAKLYR
jgi:hypothetical protein